MPDVAFISPVERNKPVQVAGQTVYRYFEDEAVRCVESIRKSKSWMADLPFYMLDMSNAKPSSETRKRLDQLGVVYVEDFYEPSASFKTPFLNEPYTGWYFERKNPIAESISVKIDLDMKLVKPIPEELVYSAEKKTLVGQYDATAQKQQRKLLDGALPFDTNFIVSHQKHGFYQTYFSACSDPELLQSSEWLELERQHGSYFLEEFALDWLHRNGKIDVQPVQWYQYGEGYPPVSSYPLDKIEQVYFLHEHIYRARQKPLDAEWDSLREQMAFAKAKLAAKKLQKRTV